jgi:hypothetical protein
LAKVGVAAVMAIVVENDLVGSVTDVAVTVTLPPEGAVAGAVYVVPTPLFVLVGLNEPHAVMVPHATVHVTSGFPETSFATVAPIEYCAFICRDAGGEGMLTEIGIGATMVICAEMDLLPSATDVAVTITVVPVGIAEGAVYVTAATLSLVPKVPHAVVLPQVTVHVTELFTTPVAGFGNIAAACSVAEAFTASDEGGFVTKITAVGSGVGGGDCEPPPQPESAIIVRQPAHPVTFVSSPARGRFIARSVFWLIHSIPYSANNAG